jgi:outer membrane receptor protein involved in Fe transport
VLSGPATDSLGYRLAVQQHESDGYIENDFLQKDDTNNLDELNLRGQLRWQAGEDLRLDFSVFYADIDNGYDAFSLDNTRHTLSDEPGHDRQESAAGSVRAFWNGADRFNLEILLSHADSDLEYGYDEDWSFADICTGTPCDGWQYTSFDNYIRDNENTSLDIRMISRQGSKIFNGSTDWVAGLYVRIQEEDLLREYTFAAADFRSKYETENYALYGQLVTALSDNLTLTYGLRVEQRDADYSDSDLAQFDMEETLWGGKLSLSYAFSANSLVYGLLSRGYKAGGVNSNSGLPINAREFDTETMWNLEFGIKGNWLNNSVSGSVALFYQDRDDLQVKQSLVAPISGSMCPCSFTDYFNNAAAGNNYGLEANVVWQASPAVQLFSSVGLLETEYEDFDSFTHVDADPANGISVDLDGHEQAHAPGYQFLLGAEFDLAEKWYLRVELEGKDEFYFSPRHEEKSDAYELFNASIGYRTDSWELALWGRNLTDEDYQVRGFGSFGNDPRKFYVTEPYHQLGEPRIVGLTANYVF